MPGKKVVVDEAYIERVRAELRNLATDADDVRVGTLPDRAGGPANLGRTPGTVHGPAFVAVACKGAGDSGFPIGAKLATKIPTVGEALDARIVNLRASFARFDRDLGKFLAENDKIEDLNRVDAKKLGDQISTPDAAAPPPPAKES
ncbi:hypothetical protein GCM10022251_74540 [Phytohabitans flavus]|uniref:Uncharacterized protein n=1 Tax=Phytohabitans flavus TaxID=1076124 RepID=A0A6F8XLJ8_9ACTN|nr:hypothetical protein [Phytohabitans flavus]BCB74692.1 hypothetical protein Pflav_011020 [Phytohabitans flavus]